MRYFDVEKFRNRPRKPAKFASWLEKTAIVAITLLVACGNYTYDFRPVSHKYSSLPQRATYPVELFSDDQDPQSSVYIGQISGSSSDMSFSDLREHLAYRAYEKGATHFRSSCESKVFSVEVAGQKRAHCYASGSYVNCTETSRPAGSQAKSMNRCVLRLFLVQNNS